MVIILLFANVFRLSPKLFLKRPITGDLTWRLDYILKRKAVMIMWLYTYMTSDNILCSKINTHKF